MNLLGLLPGVVKIAGKLLGLEGKAKEIADAIEGAPPEVRAAMEVELHRHDEALRAYDLDELKTSLGESLAMIASPDKFVSRARPMMLYVATTITALLCTAVGIAILKATHIDLGAIGAITSLMGPLWGAAGWYIHSRTKEKMNGNGNGD